MFGTVGLKGGVDYTIVNGRVIVREGRLSSIDEEKAADMAGQCVKKYLSRQ